MVMKKKLLMEDPEVNLGKHGHRCINGLENVQNNLPKRLKFISLFGKN
jgi:hypothetical protein